MRHRLPVVLVLVVAVTGLAPPGIAAAQSLPSPPAEACDLLATVASTAASIQTAVESQTGQALPAGLGDVVTGVAGQAGCGGAGGGGGTTPAELCALLATVASNAAGIQATVESQTGQPLPVSLAGTVEEVAGGAGCGDGGDDAPPPAAPAPLCAVLGALPGTAATVQQTVESQTGQPLPVDLASVVGSIAAGAGCAGDGGAGAPPEEVCGLLGSAASTAGTLQQTAEAQTGQALPADLEAVVADVAARAGCGADEPAGSGGSDSPDGPGGGSDGGAQASAGASAGGASVDASISVDELPRTGGPAAVPAVGGGLLALGGVAELLRRRLAR